VRYTVIFRLSEEHGEKGGSIEDHQRGVPSWS
jgi:hypothetical protein